VLCTFRLNSYVVQDGTIRFLRAQFLDVFVDNLPPGIANFGKRLTQYVREETGAYTLYFVDGSTATCDLLIGCDGIKSTIRRQLFTQLAEQENRPELLNHVEPVWTGALVYRGLIPFEEVPKGADGTVHRAVNSPMMVSVRDMYLTVLNFVLVLRKRGSKWTKFSVKFNNRQHIVCYMISRGSMLNVFCCRSQHEKHGEYYPEPWVTDCSCEELLAIFDGWEPELQEMLKVSQESQV
jgi:salicylate hydroxylase